MIVQDKPIARPCRNCGVVCCYMGRATKEIKELEYNCLACGAKTIYALNGLIPQYKEQEEEPP